MLPEKDSFDVSILRCGDALLYFGDSPLSASAVRAGLVDRAIAIKTSGCIAHIELYAGDGYSEASRNGVGVNRYRLRLNGLVAVRRPIVIFDWEAGEDWFTNVACNQGYDFKGLLCFYLAVREGAKDKMFCSEFALRRHRKSFVQPFNSEQDADRTSPFDYWKTAGLETVWQRNGFTP